MIQDIEEIVDVFNMFHDADIVGYEAGEDELGLIVGIPYLNTEEYQCIPRFHITLYGCKNVEFETWPLSETENFELLKTPEVIFQTPSWILSALHEEGIITVFCSQDDMIPYGYCGGSLRFSVDFIMLKDEYGQEYSVSTLMHFFESRDNGNTGTS